MGTEFALFYDILLAALLLGFTYKCARQGFASAVVGFVGMLVAFAVATAVSAPAAAYIYDEWVAPGVTGKITYEQTAGENSAAAAFATLRSADMSQALVDGRPWSEFIGEVMSRPVGADNVLKLNIKDIDLSGTGLSKGDLSFFGLDAASDFGVIGVGKIDISAADRAKYSIEDIVLARTVSFRINEKAKDKYELLSNNLAETLPGASRLSRGTEDFVAVLLLDIIINPETTNLTQIISDNLVRPVAVIPFRLIIFAVVFALIKFLTSVAANALSLIEYIPLVGKVNSFLGAVLGVAMAFVFALLVCYGVKTAIGLTGDNVILLNTMTIDKTYVFKHIYNIGFLNGI